MSDKGKKVQIFMMPQQFPCGPQSKCCGPMGQSKEEIEGLKSALEKDISCTVQVINLMGKNPQEHPSIARLLGSFGARALPVIALNGDVVSMGSTMPGNVVEALKEKLGIA